MITNLLDKVEKKYGIKARVNLAENLYRSIPQELRHSIDEYGKSQDSHPIHWYETRLNGILDYLSNPEKQKQFHLNNKHMTEQEAAAMTDRPTSPAHVAYLENMSKALAHIKNLSEKVDSRWLEGLVLHKNEETMSFDSEELKNFMYSIGEYAEKYSPEFEAAKLLSNDYQPTDDEVINAIKEHEGDIVSIALLSHHLPVTSEFKDKLKSMLSLKKSEFAGTREHEEHPIIFPEVEQELGEAHPHDHNVWVVPVEEGLAKTDAPAPGAPKPQLSNKQQQEHNRLLQSYKPEDPGTPTASEHVTWAVKTFKDPSWTKWSVNAHKNNPELFTPETKQKLEHYDAMRNISNEMKQTVLKPEHDFHSGMNTLDLVEKNFIANKGPSLIHGVPDTAKKMVDFGDGWAWWDLGKQHCREEGDAMGHCGNMGSPKEGDSVLSLRKESVIGNKKFYEPHVTFIRNGNTIGEMKGRANEKPNPKYHKKIVSLLNSGPFYPRGGGYAPKNNFSLEDLSPELKETLHPDIRSENFSKFKLHNGSPLLHHLEPHQISKLNPETIISEIRNRPNLEQLLEHVKTTRPILHEELVRTVNWQKNKRDEQTKKHNEALESLKTIEAATLPEAVKHRVKEDIQKVIEKPGRFAGLTDQQIADQQMISGMYETYHSIGDFIHNTANSGHKDPRVLKELLSLNNPQIVQSMTSSDSPMPSEAVDELLRSTQILDYPLIAKRHIARKKNLSPQAQKELYEHDFHDAKEGIYYGEDTIRDELVRNPHLTPELQQQHLDYISSAHDDAAKEGTPYWHDAHISRTPEIKNFLRNEGLQEKIQNDIFDKSGGDSGVLFYLTQNGNLAESVIDKFLSRPYDRESEDHRQQILNIIQNHNSKNVIEKMRNDPRLDSSFNYDTAERLRSFYKAEEEYGEVLNKNIGFVTYPKLGVSQIQTRPFISKQVPQTKITIKDPPKQSTMGFYTGSAFNKKPNPEHKRSVQAWVKPTESTRGSLETQKRIPGSSDPFKRYGLAAKIDANKATEANVSHESQHSVFGDLSQKYGKDKTRSIIATTLSRLPKEERTHISNLFNATGRSTSALVDPEETIAYLHNYLQDPNYRNSLHREMRITDKQGQMFSVSLARKAWNSLRNIASEMTLEDVGLTHLNKAQDPKSFSSILRASSAHGDAFVDHKPDLAAHPPAIEPEVQAYRTQVMAGPGDFRHKRKDSGITAKNIYRVNDQKFMVKPYHERVIRRVSGWQKFPIQGWAEMTNQALYHAGGIGHLHQKVHTSEHAMDYNRPPRKQIGRNPNTNEPALVVHVQNDALPLSRIYEKAGEQLGVRPKTPHDADYFIDKEGNQQKIDKNIHIISGQYGEDGAWQDFVHKKIPGVNWRAGEGDLRKIALMDFLSNNLDRHNQNLMMLPNGQPLAIDHSRSFQYVRRSRDKFNPPESRFGNLPDDELQDYIKNGAIGNFIKTDWSARKPPEDLNSEKWEDTFKWWGENSPAIHQTMKQRLSQIKDPEVKAHIWRNFRSRARVLDEMSEFGVGNFGQYDWAKTAVPMYRPNQKSYYPEDEHEDKGI